MVEAAPDSTTQANWLERVRAAEREGDFLAAYDLAAKGLAEHPGDVALRHRAVLSLARSGAREQAERAFLSLGLASERAPDVLALAARLAKDRALATPANERAEAAHRAVELYLSARSGQDDYYPLINAATLCLLGGDAGRARELAEQALGACQRARRDTPEQAYYAAATEAEAALLLGSDKAAERLEFARACLPGDHAAHATTRKQLRLVCSLTSIDTSILSALEPPAIVHVSTSAESDAVPAVRESLQARRTGFAFAGLGTPSQIAVAEALLTAGVSLHVVLPYEPHELRKMALEPKGGGWAERFDCCLERASGWNAATSDGELGDALVMSYADDLAMGLACLRARHLDGVAEQLVFARRGDQEPASAARWRALGRPQTRVETAALETATALWAQAPPERTHVLKSMLFGDVKGFSKLREADIPRFLSVAMASLAQALARYEDAIRWRNTWGDGLYVVLEGAVAAARCALELQAALEPERLAAAGLEGLTLRLAGHGGPVLECLDPVLGKTVYFGSHVNRTARIEPVTPPGSVYVTEQLAAALELEPCGMVCEYVGHMPAAKDFGSFRMYSLRSAG